MIKSTYQTLIPAFFGTFPLIAPVTAQSASGPASVSGNITNATGISFNASGSNTSANPLACWNRGPNKCSFTGPMGWEL